MKRLATVGYFLACHELGRRYYFGHDGVTEDNDTARKYFEQSAAMGYGKSMFYLGEIYYCGFGVTVDKKRGVEWYTKAYDRSSYTGASFGRIGAFYGEKQNYSEAFTWYLRGAEANYTWCLVGVALIYRYGHGVSKNYSLAVECCNCAKRSAAQNGYSESEVAITCKNILERSFMESIFS